MVIEQLVDGDLYWTKGWVDKEIFLAELERQCGRRYPTAAVDHVWRRKVPRPKAWDCDFEFMEAEPGARGAFKATVLDLCAVPSPY